VILVNLSAHRAAHVPVTNINYGNFCQVKSLTYEPRLSLPASQEEHGILSSLFIRIEAEVAGLSYWPTKFSRMEIFLNMALVIIDF